MPDRLCRVDDSACWVVRCVGNLLLEIFCIPARILFNCFSLPGPLAFYPAPSGQPKKEAVRPAKLSPEAEWKELRRRVEEHATQAQSVNGSNDARLVNLYENEQIRDCLERFVNQSSTDDWQRRRRERKELRDLLITSRLHLAKLNPTWQRLNARAEEHLARARKLRGGTAAEGKSQSSWSIHRQRSKTAALLKANKRLRQELDSYLQTLCTCPARKDELKNLWLGGSPWGSPGAASRVS